MTLTLTTNKPKAISMNMTGAMILQLLNAVNSAIDLCGKGEMRGVKLIEKLNELGVDLVIREMPPTPFAPTQQLPEEPFSE